LNKAKKRGKIKKERKKPLNLIVVIPANDRMDAGGRATHGAVAEAGASEFSGFLDSGLPLE